MWLHPGWDPVMVVIPLPFAFNEMGGWPVYWYGVAYLAGLLVAWGLGCLRVVVSKLSFSRIELFDLLVSIFIAIVIGGRLFYGFFYTNGEYIVRPWLLVQIWDGGMSFHGGVVGGLGYLWYRCGYQWSLFLRYLDFLVPLLPPALFLGRLANFINGELPGRITSVPWALVDLRIDEYARHPSALYEAGLEGGVLFIILWIYSRKERREGCITGVALLGYGCLRIVCEFFRSPDQQLGFIWFDWMTMGMILSLPMVIIGFWLWRRGQALG